MKLRTNNGFKLFFMITDHRIMHIHVVQTEIKVYLHKALNSTAHERRTSSFHIHSRHTRMLYSNFWTPILPPSLELWTLSRENVDNVQKYLIMKELARLDTSCRFYGRPRPIRGQISYFCYVIVASFCSSIRVRNWPWISFLDTERCKSSSVA